jgi:hypothetical protein
MPRAATVAAATFNTVEHLGAARRYRSTAATMARRDSAESAGAFFLTLDGRGTPRATSRKAAKGCLGDGEARLAAGCLDLSDVGAPCNQRESAARGVIVVRAQGASQSPQASNLGVELGYL